MPLVFTVFLWVNVPAKITGEERSNMKSIFILRLFCYFAEANFVNIVVISFHRNLKLKLSCSI